MLSYVGKVINAIGKIKPRKVKRNQVWRQSGILLNKVDRLMEEDASEQRRIGGGRVGHQISSGHACRRFVMLGQTP